MNSLLLLLLSIVAMAQDTPVTSKNILGTNLKECSIPSKTGFYKDGFCRTDPQDHGTHVACASVTKDFLDFTRSRGNDLITPRPDLKFSGLRPGDKWCLCALRWLEAKRAGVAPKLEFGATHKKMLEFASIKEIKE